jgi:hypothetical protein
MKTQTSDRPPSDVFGFTRLELAMILFVCGLLAVPILISALSRAAARSQRIHCTDNLKQLGLAFKTWALDNGDKFPMEVLTETGRSPQHLGDANVEWYFQPMSNLLADPKVLVCPSDVRMPAANLEGSLSHTNVSYFLGLDARDTNPQMFLAGDRNLTNGPLPSSRILVPNTNFPVGWTHEMHHYQGNIGLADGSVQQFSNNRLAEALRNPWLTNRLAMP